LPKKGLEKDNKKYGIAILKEKLKIDNLNYFQQDDEYRNVQKIGTKNLIRSQEI